MRLNPSLKTLGSIVLFIAVKKRIITLSCAFLAISLSGVVIQSQRGGDKEEKGAHPIQPVMRVSVENGNTVITLSKEDQLRLAIAVAPLQASRNREEISATAVVLPIEELITLRDSYIAARTKLEKTRIDAEVSQKEYERLRALHQDNQNISEKAVEAQHGLAQSNDAEVRAAEQQLQLQENTVRQQWGRVVSSWLLHDSPEFERILTQRDLLFQITSASQRLSTFPQTALLEIPDGSRSPAHLLSPYPRIDPRIQRISYLYLAGAHPGLVPGLNLITYLPIGGESKGVIIPSSAVVWWQGEQWVYLQAAPDRFTRRQLPSGSSLPNGFFIGTGFSPGDKVVVKGAQMLLSEESRVATPAGQKGDND